MAAKKPTTAQLTALKVVAAGGVRMRSMGAKYGTSIGGPAGSIAANTFDALLRNKWVELDRASQTNFGYDVLITEAGRSFLPQEEAGLVEKAEAIPAAPVEVEEVEVEAPAVPAARRVAGFEEVEPELEDGDFEPEYEEDAYEMAAPVEVEEVEAPAAPAARRVAGFEEVEPELEDGDFESEYEEDAYEMV